MLSLIADEKMKDGRGRIKHLAAYNAHKAILSKLLEMANKCTSEPISSAHDDQLSISRHSHSAGSLGSRQNSKQTVSFAKQLTVSTMNGSSNMVVTHLCKPAFLAKTRAMAQLLLTSKQSQLAKCRSEFPL